MLYIFDLRQNDGVGADIERRLDTRLRRLAHPHIRPKSKRVAERYEAVERCLVQDAVLHIENHDLEASEPGNLAGLLTVAFEPEGKVRRIGALRGHAHSYRSEERRVGKVYR